MASFRARISERWLRGLRLGNRKDRGLWLGLGLALLLIGVFVRLSFVLRGEAADALNNWDQSVLIALSHYRNSAFNGIAVDFTALGSVTVLTLLNVFFLMILIFQKDRRGAAYLFVGSVGSGIISKLLKLFFTRARPTIVPKLVDVSGYSYPSGHSLAAASFYILIMFIAWQKFPARAPRIAFGTLAVGIILGICFSRLYLG
ncbi:MAG: phosphatase PAP2 family protein, partial [Proteobacteria bacterium]